MSQVTPFQVIERTLTEHNLSYTPPPSRRTWRIPAQYLTPMRLLDALQFVDTNTLSYLEVMENAFRAARPPLNLAQQKIIYEKMNQLITALLENNAYFPFDDSARTAAPLSAYAAAAVRARGTTRNDRLPFLARSFQLESFLFRYRWDSQSPRSEQIENEVDKLNHILNFVERQINRL